MTGVPAAWVSPPSLWLPPGSTQVARPAVLAPSHLSRSSVDGFGASVATLTAVASMLGSVVSSSRRQKASRRRRAMRAAEGREAAPVGGIAIDTVDRPSRTGVVLLNVGTPKSTSVEDVRDYLHRFLSDDRIKIADPVQKEMALKRILETRPQIAAESYKKIWDPDRGAPLLFHTGDLKTGLQRALGDNFIVEFAFQYSEPTVDEALRKLASQGADSVVLASMFPHYATATTGGCLSGAYRKAVDYFPSERISVIEPFYRDDGFLDATAQGIRAALAPEGALEHILFTFHGSPEDQVSRTQEDVPAPCKFCKPGICQASLDSANAQCYRAQCFETARLIAARLNLSEDKWSIGFQSRISVRGTASWIGPHTDEQLKRLGERGIQRLVVAAPSYTVDCLETLDELARLGTEQFRAGGGKELVVVPCLNGSDAWVEGFSSILRQHWLDLARVVLMHVVSSLQ